MKSKFKDSKGNEFEVNRSASSHGCKFAVVADFPKTDKSEAKRGICGFTMDEAETAALIEHNKSYFKATNIETIPLFEVNQDQL